MFSSVRVRLTFWYIGLLALVLGVFSLGVYILLSRSLHQRLDAGLRSALEVTALSLNHEIEEHGGKIPGEEALRMVLHTMHQTSFPRQSIAVFEGERLLAYKPGEAGPEIQSSPAGLGQDVEFHILKGLDADYRFAARSVHIPSIRTHYNVVASESMQETKAELRTLREVLMLVVPLTLILAAFGGYLLARKSLRPVVHMSDAVERISSTNLDQRLVVANPGDELGRLASTFNRLLERLNSVFSQQRQFMADASHELRTPISVARTAAQVTLGGKERRSDEYRDALLIVDEQLQRLARLVKDMFLLARADSGAYRIQPSRFYLEELLAEAARAALVLGDRKGVHVMIFPMTESPFSGDEGLVRQLALILLDNAVKYTPSGGSVQLALERRVDSYAILVRDTGPGIPETEQGRIFQRFYRVDKARSRAEAEGEGAGAGLGLAIAQWIAQAHGGPLTLTSSGPAGSLFTALLPWERETEAPAATAAPKQEAAEVSR